jgi:hypothetical protein
MAELKECVKQTITQRLNKCAKHCIRLPGDAGNDLVRLHRCAYDIRQCHMMTGLLLGGQLLAGVLHSLDVRFPLLKREGLHVHLKSLRGDVAGQVHESAVDVGARVTEVAYAGPQTD